jgi:hypothetical protein
MNLNETKAMYEKQLHAAREQFNAELEDSPRAGSKCGQISKGSTHEIPQLLAALRDRQMQSLESLAALHKKLNPILRAQPTCETNSATPPASTDLGRMLADNIALMDQLLNGLSEIHETLEL